MTDKEIKVLDMDGVDARLKEIAVESDNATAEALEAYAAEVDMLDARKKEITADIERRKALMEKVAKGAGTVKETGAAAKKTVNELRASDEYAVAYANYIKTGSDRECRAVITDIGGGTVPTPTVLEEAIETAWEQAQIVSKARKVSVKGTLSVPYEASATGAAVHTEGGDAVDEETVEIGKIVITPESLMKWITVTGEVMLLNGVDFLNYIIAEISQKIAELADERMVAKIQASDFTQSLTGGTTWTDILAAQALLGSAADSPAVICTKSDFFTGFAAQVDSSNRPIYNIISENGKPVYNINGLPVLFTEALENGTYIVGDMDGALVNLPDGEAVTFITDPYTYAEKDVTKITGKLYAGMDVVKMKHFVVVTAAAE